jgi:PAS domain S-box-containing protein
MDKQSSQAGSSQLIHMDELFEHIVSGSTDFAICTTRPDGTTTSWNIGAERVFGYAADEILGRSIDVIFTAADREAGTPEQERAAAARKGRAEDERWHLRKDGSLFWGSGVLTPLRKPGEGFVKIVRDQTAQHNAAEALRRSEERFRLLSISIPQLVFCTRPNGDRTWGSQQWIDFTGLNLAQSLGFGWLNAIHPDDLMATQAAWQSARETGEYYVEHRVQRAADREYRWHQTRALPIQTSQGPGQEWIGTMTDIHDLRGLKDRQQVLVAELQHRTRNLLAVVQAIAAQTLRKSDTLQTFSREYEGRLGALSRVQSLLARPDQEEIDLHGLVRAELVAHGDGGLETGKISIQGPPVALPSNSAQAVGLALHELATNAVKYGALAQTAGKLTITWDLAKVANEMLVRLEWRERGVRMPQNGAPTRRGYGTELIQRALPYQLKAKTQLEFAEDGVRCAIAVPVGPQAEEAGHE